MSAVSTSSDPRGAAPAPRRRRAPHPGGVATSFWRHRHLLLPLARRDVVARYRESWLGIAWAVLAPALSLATFTFVFGTIFEARWDVQLDSKTQFALVLFTGLVAHGFAAEVLNRAPGLVLERPNYVKRVVFPLEILPWVATLAALFQAGVSLLVLVAAYAAIVGPPPVAALCIPLLYVPLALVVTGIAWFLASMGVYLRDLKQFVPVLTTLLLFLSPIFYPLSAVPEPFRSLVAANPLAWIVESSRGALFAGRFPDARELALATLAGWAVAWLGLVWFAKTRRGFADVV
jgi:lipopolysaccharide transport system permease protein